MFKNKIEFTIDFLFRMQEENTAVQSKLKEYEIQIRLLEDTVREENVSKVDNQFFRLIINIYQK
jgi:hypothetical protein